MSSGYGVALQLENIHVDQPWIYIILLALGGILFLIQFKYMFFPTWKGVIIGFKDLDLDPDNCKSCNKAVKSKSSIDIKVKTDDGEVLDAEIGPCTLCLNKLTVGSRVGVSKIGTRNIAQPVVKLTSNSNW